MLIGQDITIIGGGVAGLAAATALAQRGAQVTVLEQAEAIKEVGAGLQISPNGLAVLRSLGLQDQVERLGWRGQQVCLCAGHTGAQVLRLDIGKAPGGYHFFHRADLIEMLAGSARDAGVKIRLLQNITGVTSCDDHVELTTAQGARIRAGLVLGADGLHSVVRTALNGASRPKFTGQVAWRATVPATAQNDHSAMVFMGPGRHLVRYPLRGGTMMNIVAIEERRDWAPESWSHQDEPANLRAAFQDFAPAALDLLNKVEQVHLWGLFRHPVAESWHNGRMAVLGDAAHPTLPFMAQGANMALEDAWVLAAALSAQDQPAQGFAAYQAARRERCTKIVETASKNARNYHLSGAKRVVGHLALRAAGAVAPDKMLRQFDWIYRHDVTRIFS